MAEPNVPARSVEKTVVFVDNDQFFLGAIADSLREKGLNVLTARDGLEALSVIREVRPDFILLDIVLPQLDGGQICAAVRQDPALRNIPIIAFSGLSPQDYRFFPQLSADAYVAKGPLATAADNILIAISHLEETGREKAEGQVLGYENFRSRQIVKELLIERRHLAAILRALASGVVELNREGRIVMVNPRACEVLGKLEGLLVGELFSSLFPLPHRSRVQELMTDLARSSESAHLWSALPVGGTEVPMRLAAIVEENECTGILVTLEAKES